MKYCEKKCAVAAKDIGGPVITEDTSLCYYGLSSPYIILFLEKDGHNVLNQMMVIKKLRVLTLKFVTFSTIPKDNFLYLMDLLWKKCVCTRLFNFNQDFFYPVQRG